MQSFQKNEVYINSSKRKKNYIMIIQGLENTLGDLYFTTGETEDPRETDLPKISQVMNT